MERFRNSFVWAAKEEGDSVAARDQRQMKHASRSKTHPQEKERVRRIEGEI